MPMIPVGKVDGPRVAGKVEKFSWPTVAMPVVPTPPEPQSDYCLTPDGFIDNKAQTNKWAQEVAELLGEEMDVTSPVFCAGIVILAGNPLNYRFGKVADFTGLPRRFCQKVIQNLGYNRLVFGRRLGGDLMAELDKPNEADVNGPLTNILFVLYCLAGAGQIRCDKGMWSAMPEDDKFFHEIEKVA